MAHMVQITNVEINFTQWISDNSVWDSLFAKMWTVMKIKTESKYVLKLKPFGEQK